MLNTTRKITRKTQHIVIEITNLEKERDIRTGYVAYIAMHSALKSVDHLNAIMKIIGKGMIFENMGFHRTKATRIITNVLATSIHDRVIADVKEFPYFSLNVNESRDISVVK